MHDSVEVLFDLFDVFLRSHEPLHKDIKFLVETDNLDTCIAQSWIMQRVTALVLIVLTLSINVMGYSVDSHCWSNIRI
jgi:hypothetical protein